MMPAPSVREPSVAARKRGAAADPGRSTGCGTRRLDEAKTSSATAAATASTTVAASMPSRPGSARRPAAPSPAASSTSPGTSIRRGSARRTPPMRRRLGHNRISAAHPDDEVRLPPPGPERQADSSAPGGDADADAGTPDRCRVDAGRAGREVVGQHRPARRPAPRPRPLLRAPGRR